MAQLIVNPTSYDITDINQNTITINYSTDVVLSDVKLSLDNGNSYIDNMSMAQNSAMFNIEGVQNNTYTCKLKGYYEEHNVDNVADIVLNQTSYQINQGEDFVVNYTSPHTLSTCMLYYSPYGDDNYSGGYISRNGEFTFYTSSKSEGTYTVKIKGRVWNGNSYDDYYSNEFSLIIGDGSNDNVTQIPVTGIECSDWDVHLQVDQTKQITASVVPSNATNKLIHWYSDNTSVATVSSNGLITAKGVGYSKVTATTDDGGHRYDIHVNVTASSGGSDSGGGGSTVNDEYALSCTSDYILDKMYPMGQSHEAIPSGNITGWKYNTRWENQDRPYAMSHSCGQSGCPGTGAFQALGCWSNIYRVEGSPFSQNTGVEMKDIKVYGWYNGKWELVQHLPVPNGNFYAESFSGDSNRYFGDSVKQSSTSKTIILREANKINSENCMYHPFSNVKAFDTKYQYIYTCIDLRKVKWDENGVDDRDQTHYCSNCGGDWWLAEGLTFHDSWQHNKGVCQPKMIEITNEWRRFSMTTVPQNWQYGFPK